MKTLLVLLGLFSLSFAVGGPRPMSVHDHKVLSIAGDFATDYLGSNGGSCEVLSATTQVVAGSLTTVNCRTNPVQGKSEICQIKVWEKVWENFKQTTSNCTSHKRQLAGGLTPQNPANAAYQTLAQEFVDQYLGASNGATFQVVNVSTQVVAGSNTYLTILVTHGGMTEQCKIVVWEKPWMNFKQITSQHCIPKIKRQLLLGGPMKHDVHDPKVQQLAQTFMTNDLGLNGGAVEVLSYKTQVVAGVNYLFTVKVTSGSMVKYCAVTVYERSWENYSSTSSNCTSPMGSRRQLGGMPGGVHSVSLTDPDLLGAVNFAVDAANQRVNSAFRMSLLNVISATQQVVAGMSYHVTFQLGQSTCMNNMANMGNTLLACPVNSNAMTVTCEATIWDQAWRKPRYQLSKGPDCSDDNKKLTSAEGNASSFTISVVSVVSAAFLQLCHYYALVCLMY